MLDIQGLKPQETENTLKLSPLTDCDEWAGPLTQVRTAELLKQKSCGESC